MPTPSPSVGSTAHESIIWHRPRATTIFTAMTRRRFDNPWKRDDHGILDILLWKLGIRHQERPLLPDAGDGAAACEPLDPATIASPPNSGWRVTWLGHSSFLVQGAGRSFLIDPVFGTHCSPLPLPSLRRLAGPPIGMESLPRIDAVLLSHSHYDHCEIRTLRHLGKDMPLIVPEGHGAWLGAKGFTDVRETPWWSTQVFPGGIAVTATPARHFTARSPFDRNLAHWCGWHISGAGCQLWHAGDSGWCPAFREIGAMPGGIDLGMIPIGAYQPRSIMRPMHMNPEEAVDAFEETGCRRAVAMHWGTFRLTDEPMGEPPLRLRDELRRRHIADDRFLALKIGQSLLVEPRDT